MRIAKDMENPNIPVKCLMTQIHSKDARVAEFEIEPETEGESHYHSSVSEQCICLQGHLQIKVNGGAVHSLQPGEKIEIPAGIGHQVINNDGIACRYLVIQFGGEYDFVAK